MGLEKAGQQQKAAVDVPEKGVESEVPCDQSRRIFLQENIIFCQKRSSSKSSQRYLPTEQYLPQWSDMEDRAKASVFPEESPIAEGEGRWASVQ